MKRVKTKTKVAKARRKPAETTDYKMTGLIWYDFTKELESASTSEPNRPTFDTDDMFVPLLQAAARIKGVEV
jgi:hypothetical protein